MYVYTVAFGLEKNVDITIDPQLIPQVIIELNNYTTFSKLDLKVSEEAEDDFYMRVARVSGSVNEADELLINVSIRLVSNMYKYMHKNIP